MMRPRRHQMILRFCSCIMLPSICSTVMLPVLRRVFRWCILTGSLLLNLVSSKHTRITLSVRLRKQKIKGGDAEWLVVSVDDESMVIDYNSGVLNVDGSVVRRKCRFVFRKVGDTVVMR